MGNCDYGYSTWQCWVVGLCVIASYYLGKASGEKN